MYSFQTTKNEFGIFFQNKDIQIGFGSKALTKDILKELNPQIQLQYLNQTHSSIISIQPDLAEECDGYQWNNPNFSAVIRTADCLPLIAVDHNSNKISNLHCGRTGLVNGILDSFVELSNTSSPHSFFIGPHIETYEIGKDLYLALKSKKISNLFSLQDKYYFSLAGFTKDFIKNNFKHYKIHETLINTLSDNSYWSYRRDKGTIDRNLSYAFLKERPSR